MGGRLLKARRSVKQVTPTRANNHEEVMAGYGSGGCGALGFKCASVRYLGGHPTEKGTNVTPLDRLPTAVMRIELPKHMRNR